MTRTALILLLTCNLVTGAPVYDPSLGLVQNEKTAVKIAEAILFQMFEEKLIVSQRPYKVKEDDDKWIITGTFHSKENGDMVGGTFHITISKKDARVLEVGHGV